MQVIVKYSSIVISPEQPRYEAWLWEVEGMKNECVVAVCSASLRNDNISPSRLDFASMVNEPVYDRELLPHIMQHAAPLRQ